MSKGNRDLLARTRDDKKKSRFLDKLKVTVKSGIDSAKERAKEDQERRKHLRDIGRKERKRQEEKLTRYKVQEEYRVKRAGVRESRTSRSAPVSFYDPFADIFEGPPQPRQKKRKSSKKKRKKKKK